MKTINPTARGQIVKKLQPATQSQSNREQNRSMQAIKTNNTSAGYIKNAVQNRNTQNRETQSNVNRRTSVGNETRQRLEEAFRKQKRK